MTEQNKEQVNNGLASAMGLTELPAEQMTQNIIISNATNNLLSLNFVPLANTYKSNGFAKLAVDLPVSDCFRDGGYELDSATLNSEELKELNDKAGRWATDWGKGVSDMMNTDQVQAYNEFEGKAKQYVQDQLKKIYGAQMTEAEGERFFKSMGLSPKLDPNLRWKLVENALDDLARKNGTTILTQQAAVLPQKGQIVDGYEFLGGDPADAKNWRAK